VGLLPGFVKSWVMKREAKSLGEKLARNGGAVLNFLKRNQKYIGLGFLAASAWASEQACAPILGGAVDVIAIIHQVPVLASVTCTQIAAGLLVAGAFLGGAGLLPSDKHHATVQGLRAPMGAPYPRPEDVNPKIAAKRQQ